MTEELLYGGCFCGNLRFEVAGPETYCCFCHCESCRKASGGAYVPWATFAKQAFRLTSGTLMLHESSPGVTRGHCPRCGTSVTYEHEGRPGQIDITLACFDDASGFRPRAHIWVGDKPAWISLDDGLPRYSRHAGSTEV